MRALSFLVLCVLASSAFAAPVTWTFDNVVFDDGGTLTGSFVFDADSTTIEEGDCHPTSCYYQIFYLDIDIVAGDPAEVVTGVDQIFAISSDRYIDSWGNADARGYEVGEVLDWDTGEPLPVPEPSWEPGALQTGLTLSKLESNSPYDIYRTLYLSFAAPLTNAGGVIDVSGYETGEVYDPGGLVIAGSRTIVSGQVFASSVVPVPASVWLFGSALGGLGWVRRRLSHA